MRTGLMVVVAAMTVALVACGHHDAVSGAALHSYLAEVQPVRLSVDELLEDADPILDAYTSHRITSQQASDQMTRLERRFAAYTVQIAAVAPSNATLARINAPYAHTYILEDSYLNALVAALPDGSFDSLPNTQSEQTRRDHRMADPARGARPAGTRPAAREPPASRTGRDRADAR